MKRVVFILLAVIFLFCAGCSGTHSEEVIAPVPGLSDLIAAAERFILEGNYEEALVQYELALQIEPRDVHLLVQTAKAYAAMNRGAEAIQSYRKAIAIEPGNISLYIDAAEICRRAGAEEEAIAIFSEGKRHEGNSSSFAAALMAYKASQIQTVDWQAAYRAFLEEDIKLCLSSENVDYMPGYAYALEDLNFDGIPELLSLRDVGNAYGDVHLFIYTLNAGKVKLQQKTLFIFGGDTLEKDGLHAFENVNTGDITYINRGTYGNVDHGVELMEMGSLYADKLYIQPVFSMKAGSVSAGETYPEEAHIIILDEENRNYELYYINGQIITKDRYQIEYEDYWSQWKQLDWELEWVDGGLFEQHNSQDYMYLASWYHVQSAIGALFSKYSPRFLQPGAYQPQKTVMDGTLLEVADFTGAPIMGNTNEGLMQGAPIVLGEDCAYLIGNFLPFLEEGAGTTWREGIRLLKQAGFIEERLMNIYRLEPSLEKRILVQGIDTDAANLNYVGNDLYYTCPNGTYRYSLDTGDSQALYHSGNSISYMLFIGEKVAWIETELIEMGFPPVIQMYLCASDKNFNTVHKVPLYGQELYALQDFNYHDGKLYWVNMAANQAQEDEGSNEYYLKKTYDIDCIDLVSGELQTVVKDIEDIVFDFTAPDHSLFLIGEDGLYFISRSKEDRGAVDNAVFKQGWNGTMPVRTKYHFPTVEKRAGTYRYSIAWDDQQCTQYIRLSNSAKTEEYRLPRRWDFD